MLKFEPESYERFARIEYQPSTYEYAYVVKDEGIWHRMRTPSLWTPSPQAIYGASFLAIRRPNKGIGRCSHGKFRLEKWQKIMNSRKIWRVEYSTLMSPSAVFLRINKTSGKLKCCMQQVRCRWKSVRTICLMWFICRWNLRLL